MLRQLVGSHLGRAQYLWTGTRCFSASQQQEDVADVVIVGGGMVGAAVAALLANNPLTASMRVLVLDQRPQTVDWNPPPSPEIRVSTVTPATIQILKRAGAWDAIGPLSAHFNTMQVWDAAGAGCIRWSAQDTGMTDMGAVAENSLMQASLLASARAASPDANPSAPDGTNTAISSSGSKGGVEFVWPAVIEGLSLPPYSHLGGAGQAEGPAGSELATIQLKGGKTLRARLVVAADGAASRVRSLAGLRTFGWPYGQRGVVATVELHDSIADTAWQRFLPTGPLAVLPVRGGSHMANIVWSVPPALAAELEKMSPTEFGEAINKVLSDPPVDPTTGPTGPLASLPLVGPLASRLADTATSALGSLSSAVKPHKGEDSYHPPPRVSQWVGTSPKSFPLQLKHAGRYVRPRLVLVGDAAHAVHPLAGQGVNLGFGDAGQLATALAYAKETGQDIGSMVLLEDHYEGPRRKANTAMITALEGVWRFFGIQAGPLAAVRNLGMSLFNATPLVKNNIMQYAMGTW